MTLHSIHSACRAAQRALGKGALPVAIVALLATAAAPVAAQRMDLASAERAPVQSARPGDVVRLRIWREPDMSGDYPVDIDGVATFPRLGTMQVASMTPDSLQKLLVRGYARYLKNPSIEVVLLRRVRVVGAVRSPGVFTVDQTVKIRDVLALAGGASADGRTDRARLDRDGTTTMISLTTSPQTDDVPLRSGDQLYVEQRSWFARNTALVATMVSVSAGLLFALVAR